MPWRVEKRGDKYAVLKKGSGNMVAMHPSNAAAQAQVKALYADFNKGSTKMPKTRNAQQIRLSSAATRRNRLKTPVSDVPSAPKKKKLKVDTQYDFETGVKPRKTPQGPSLTNNGVGSGGSISSSPVGNKLGMVGGNTGQFESKTFDPGYYHKGKTIGR